jgi:hypothetical protein
MSRLCERPGCSENAALAYGMRTEDLVFWIDVLGDSTSPGVGVLCRRHGDSMVVPRGWTLDDLRDPDLHLFRPPAAPERIDGSRRRRRPSNPAGGESRQLELDDLAPPVAEADEQIHTSAADTTAEADVVVDRADADVDDEAEQWTPAFDDADDLDGLLSARSPLLSRAFRGTDRPG